MTLTKGARPVKLSKVFDHYQTHQFRNITLFTATKFGFIDNNIKLTLDTIFRHNAPFFIKDKPYLVDSYSWTWGDWRIDTKKLEDKFLVQKKKEPQ